MRWLPTSTSDSHFILWWWMRTLAHWTTLRCHIMHEVKVRHKSLNSLWVLFKWAHLTGYFLTPAALWPCCLVWQRRRPSSPPGLRCTWPGQDRTARRGSSSFCVRQRPPHTNLTGRHKECSRNATFHAASEKTESHCHRQRRRRRWRWRRRGKKPRAMGLCERVRFGIGSSWVRYTHMRSVEIVSDDFDIDIKYFILRIYYN